MATNKQECKHTHPHVQCSPASVGLAQACSNYTYTCILRRSSAYVYHRHECVLPIYSIGAPPSYEQVFGVRRMQSQVKEARDTSSNKGTFAVKFCEIVCGSGMS